jgi:predicted amidohydrolase YtcJ
MGRGWHQEKWDETPQPNVDGVPLHDGLSAVSPDNPVLLGHASGHAAFANAKAMQLAGITAETPDPDGGTIVHDADGNPTGLLRETAQRLVRAANDSGDDMTAEDREARFRQIVELAGQEALSKGVTSFQDAGSSFATIDGFRMLAAEGALPIRLYVMVRGQSNEEMDELLPQYRIIPEGNDFLAVRSIKRQIDGALGPHGAWLLEPYEDLDSTGLMLESVEDIEGTAQVALKHGFQVNTHAIGDRANREVLDLYERAFGGAGEEYRWRIEHAQHLTPQDIGRFAGLGVIASMQGIHCTSDAPWVYRRLGEERAAQGAYVWRALIDSGAIVTNGTDVPVEDIDPIASYSASVYRMTRAGELFFQEQAMTREEALRSYTINGAYAAFEEHLKGSLEVGKLADITILSQDLLTVPDEQIIDTKVDMTIVGGEVRYRRE